MKIFKEESQNGSGKEIVKRNIQIKICLQATENETEKKIFRIIQKIELPGIITTRDEKSFYKYCSNCSWLVFVRIFTFHQVEVTLN